jgi:cytochrome c oxidase assembly factor CtaG
VIPGTTAEHTPSRGVAFRFILVLTGVALWILCLVPPLSQWSRQYQYVESIQYCLFAISIPALLVAGAPWRRIGLASRSTYQFNADGISAPATRALWLDRVAMSRVGRPAVHRAYVLGTLFCLSAIMWRTVPAVNALVHHPWLAPVESVMLVGVGVALWLDLVESAPLRPGTTRPYRIGMSAMAMWTIWVLAYLSAMSARPWYGAFAHVAGHHLSSDIDQQISAGCMWFLSAGAFLPVIFWNLVHWLQSEEDPDDELYRLMRNQRIFGGVENGE